MFFSIPTQSLLNRMDNITQTGIHLSFIQHRFVKRKYFPHHPLRHRPGIFHRHEEPRPSLHDLLGDVADRASHDRGAAGQGLEDGGREGVGPGGVEVEVSGLIVPCDLFEVFLVGDEPDRDVADLFRR